MKNILLVVTTLFLSTIIHPYLCSNHKAYEDVCLESQVTELEVSQKKTTDSIKEKVRKLDELAAVKRHKSLMVSEAKNEVVPTYKEPLEYDPELISVQREFKTERKFSAAAKELKVDEDSYSDKYEINCYFEPTSKDEKIIKCKTTARLKEYEVNDSTFFIQLSFEIDGTYDYASIEVRPFEKEISHQSTSDLVKSYSRDEPAYQDDYQNEEDDLGSQDYDDE